MLRILALAVLAIAGCAVFIWHALEPRRQQVATPYDVEDGLEMDRRLPGS